MEKVKKGMLEKLRNVKNMEEYNLEMLGKKDDIEIDDVKYLGEAQLEYKEDGKKRYETINVYSVIEGKTIKYYSDDMPLAAETRNIGHKKAAIIPSPEYEKNYEKDNPIRDIIENLKQKEIEEQEKPKEERTVMSLNDLEDEEKKERDKKNKKQDKEKSNDLERIKPRYVIQSINVDSTYIDNKTTIREGFNLPPKVKEIAVAKPMQNDENALAADITIYMLDDKGCIIKNVDGKTTDDLFIIDRATGKEPMIDKNTKIELAGYAKRDPNHTIRRFRSKENPELYLSAEQKRIDDYAKLYAGRKTMDGNNAVEIQLETRNVGIQTSLEMQEIVAGYKGIYNVEDIAKDVDEIEEQGEDTENILIENEDAKENDEGFGPWDRDEYEGRVPWKH